VPISKLELSGFRGFATKQTVYFAKPNGKNGSGLTVVVGPNNAGKSTIGEALKAISSDQTVSFTEGKRNRAAANRIEITVFDEEGPIKVLRTISSGGSETEIEWIRGSKALRILSLPSRRQFDPYFGKSELNREHYSSATAFPQTRGAGREAFAYRLFGTLKNRTAFDALLSRVIDPVPDWTIEQSDNGQYYLKLKSGDQYHSSEGMGEGLVSLFIVIDALYDSAPGDFIAIDEPELSLHPALQRKLQIVLEELSADRQIVCATHSPYFLSFQAVVDGGNVLRVRSGSNGSEIYLLSEDARRKILGLIRNLNNPHILGLDAREVLFLEDNVVLVEGQEDAVIYPKVLEQIGLQVGGSIFGWGVGGAENMTTICTLLSDLGFKKVVGIFDKNRAQSAEALSQRFADYKFLSIPADDVRSKPAVTARPEVVGLLDRSGNLSAESADAVRVMFTSIKEYFEK